MTAHRDGHWLRHAPRPLPAPIRAVIVATLPDWPRLDVAERARLEEIAADLLHRPSWEPARGFALDDQIRGTIVGHAALLGIGLPPPVFRNVTAIVVHPATMALTGPRPGPMPGTVTDEPRPVLGHTSAHGPVFIAWDVAREQARHPERGYDVVFHEFAHKLDAEDGTVDGTPLLPDRAAARRWVAVCEAEYRDLRAGSGSPLLRDYAATTPGEFFAVVTEVFFDRGALLREDRPALYRILRDYYGQDPADRRPA